MGLFKKLSTLALGTTMILGLGLSLGLNNNVAVKADDDSNTWGIIGGFTSNNWVSDVATSTYNSGTDKHVVSYIIPQWTNFKIRQNGVWTHAINGTTLASVNSDYFGDGGANDYNAFAKVGGKFTFSISPKDDPAAADITVVYEEVSSYTVTKYAVVNGVKEETAIGTETVYSNLDFYPSYVLKAGYYTENWYTDEACTMVYENGKITSDTDLYAKYVAVTDVKYCYFTVDGWSDVKAYSYGGQNQFGAWADGAVLPMTDGAKFNNVGAVYKATYYTEYGDTHIIFHGTSNDKSVQTANLGINGGVCYLSTDAENNTGDTDLGTAAALVYDINAARVAVTAAEPILAKSYCGVSKDTATTLLAEYDVLNETAKGYVDASTDYTYVYTDTTQSVDVPFTSIIAQLRLIKANGSGSFGSLHNDSDTSTMLFIILGVAILGVTTAGYFYFSKKRKVSSK